MITSAISNSSGPDHASLKRPLARFKRQVERLEALKGISEHLSWDMQTYLPEKGINALAWKMKHLEMMQNRILRSEKLHDLLTELKERINELSPEDRAMVNLIAKAHERVTKVPKQLLEEFAEASVRGYSAWEIAKESNDFSKYEPHLEKLVSIVRSEIEHRGYKDSPYNLLLDDYEPGLTTKQLDHIFSRLKEELIPIISKIKNSKHKPESAFLFKAYDHGEQMRLSKVILEAMGFNFSESRLDESMHPFCSLFGPGDVRMTTFIYPKDIIHTLTSATHEGGHGLYDMGVDPKFYKTPLFDGASCAIHESQSRLYETIVGQGMPFWNHFFPILKEAFPEQLKDVSVEDFYKAINKVESSPIRIEADEVTYQLHVLIRYEIERDLIEGKLVVKDLPKVWNQKMQDYLGITPESDSRGVMQDVHWSEGSFGYFPSYTLGNLYAAQFYNTAKKEIPDLELEISKGNLIPLKNWLNEKVHRYGALETPGEIIKRVTGEPLNPDYFINYIKEKYEKLYP